MLDKQRRRGSVYIWLKFFSAMGWRDDFILGVDSVSCFSTFSGFTKEACLIMLLGFTVHRQLARARDFRDEASSARESGEWDGNSLVFNA